jgi:hypothetical protein
LSNLLKVIFAFTRQLAPVGMLPQSSCATSPLQMAYFEQSELALPSHTALQSSAQYTGCANDVIRSKLAQISPNKSGPGVTAGNKRWLILNIKCQEESQLAYTNLQFAYNNLLII